MAIPEAPGGRGAILWIGIRVGGKRLCVHWTKDPAYAWRIVSSGSGALCGGCAVDAHQARWQRAPLAAPWALHGVLLRDWKPPVDGHVAIWQLMCRFCRSCRRSWPSATWSGQQGSKVCPGHCGRLLHCECHQALRDGVCGVRWFWLGECAGQQEPGRIGDPGDWQAMRGWAPQGFAAGLEVVQTPASSAQHFGCRSCFAGSSLWWGKLHGLRFQRDDVWHLQGNLSSADVWGDTSDRCHKPLGFGTQFTGWAPPFRRRGWRSMWQPYGRAAVLALGAYWAATRWRANETQCQPERRIQKMGTRPRGSADRCEVSWSGRWEQHMAKSHVNQRESQPVSLCWIMSPCEVVGVTWEITCSPCRYDQLKGGTSTAVRKRAVPNTMVCWSRLRVPLAETTNLPSLQGRFRQLFIFVFTWISGSCTRQVDSVHTSTCVYPHRSFPWSVLDSPQNHILVGEYPVDISCRRFPLNHIIGWIWLGISYQSQYTGSCPDQATATGHTQHVSEKMCSSWRLAASITKLGDSTSKHMEVSINGGPINRQFHLEMGVFWGTPMTQETSI